jgi:hypothetical protein
VLATQYRDGGSGEWGGRYFTMALPIAVPLVLTGLAALGREVGPRARPVWGSLAVATLLLTILSARVLIDAHRGSLRFADAILASTAVAGDDGEPAVVVATAGFVPRMSLEGFGERRWMLVDREGDDYEAHLEDVADRLAELGLERWFLITAPDDEVGPGVVARGATATDPRTIDEGHSWQIVEVVPG